MIHAALLEHATLWPLLLLVPLVWLALRLMEGARRRRVAAHVGARVAILAPGFRVGARAGRRYLFCAGLLLAILAALGPRIGPPQGTAEWRGVDVVVCLDVSRSMLARDIAPDRLDRAKQEIVQLAERAAGDRLGLVLFAGEARLAVPLTNDLRSFAEMVMLADTTSVSRGGTDLGAAIGTALDALDARTSDHGAILLITDGEDLSQRGLTAAAACRERGVALHAVGFGTARGSKITVPLEGGGEVFLRDRTGAEVVTALDRTSLERLVDASDGAYLQADEEDAPLLTLHEAHVLPHARAADAALAGRRSNAYPWFLGLAILLWMLGLLAPVGRHE